MLHIVLVILTLLQSPLFVMAPASQHKSLSERYDEALALYEKGDFKTSLEKVEPIIKETLIKDEDGLLGAALSLGMASAQYVGDFTLALRYAEDLIKYDEEQEDKEGFSTTLSNIAAIYTNMGQPRNAANYIERSITITKALGDEDNLAIRYGIAAEICAKLDSLNVAMNYAKMAYELDKKNGNEEMLGVRLSQISSVYLSLEEYDRALTAAQEGLKYLDMVADDDEDRNVLAILFGHIGAAEIGLGRTKEGIEHLETCLEMCRTNHNANIERKTLNGLRNAYIGIDERKALQYSDEYISLSDSLYTSEVARYTAYFDHSYESKVREYEDQIQETNSRWTRAMVALSSMFAFLAILTAVGFYFLSHWRKTQNIELKQEIESKDRVMALMQTATNSGDVTAEMEATADGFDTIGFSNPMALTKRQREIVAYACKGLTNKEIASKLGLSVRTVDTHKTNIFRKLGINSTVELMKFAIESGLISNQ